jgi:hypothetical protein
MDLWTGPVASLGQIVLRLPAFSKALDSADLVRKPEVPAAQVFSLHQLSRELEVRLLPKSTVESEARRDTSDEAGFCLERQSRDQAKSLRLRFRVCFWGPKPERFGTSKSFRFALESRQRRAAPALPRSANCRQFRPSRHGRGNQIFDLGVVISTQRPVHMGSLDLIHWRKRSGGHRRPRQITDRAVVCRK